MESHTLEVLDLEQQGGEIVCNVEGYVADLASNRPLKINWNAVECPKDFTSVGDGVVFVEPTETSGQYARRSKPDSLGGGKYAWRDTAHHGSMLIIVILPPGCCVKRIDDEYGTPLARSKVFKSRMAVLWELGEEDHDISWDMEAASPKDDLPTIAENLTRSAVKLKRDLVRFQEVGVKLSSFQVPSPRNWQDFETICCDLWRAIWNDPNTQKNGRQGQAQHGVDVFGRPNQEAIWAGVQCKGKNNYTGQKVTAEELLGEVEKAKEFTPSLSEYTIATTAPRDAGIQKLAREITAKHIVVNLFSVHVCSWEDILESLDGFPEVVAKYYPGFSARGAVVTAVDAQEKKIVSPNNALLKVKSFQYSAGFPQHGWAKTFSAIDPSYADLTVNDIIERVFSTSNIDDIMTYLAAMKHMYASALRDKQTLERFIGVCRAFGVDYENLS